MRNKQFIVRNLVWNKHYSNVLKNKNDKQYETIAEKLLHDLKQDSRIKYCLFSIERGDKQNNNSFHFQGYLEFNKRVDAVAFNKQFNFTDIQNRKGTQLQAINYVKKKESKLSDKLYEFGKPKGNIRRYNIEDSEIPDNIDDQRILLNHRLKENYYKTFQDIENDFELLFIKHDKWCKNLWEKYHPIEVLDVIPLKVIWLYGSSGVGKSYWTNYYLKQQGYVSNEIAFKKASSETNPKLWFHISDEGKKVLWIEEVRLNFPHYNDMIQFIDRKDYLPVKGSMIKNTFELIIVNSLLSPAEVYNNLRITNQKEVLRRIYFSTQENKIYKFTKGNPYPPIIIDKSEELPKVIEDLEYLRSK